MEFLKWVGSLLLSIIGISVFIGGGIALAAFGAVISSVLLAAFCVVIVAYGIKEYFDHISHRDD